jgi:hypothetical protein
LADLPEEGPEDQPEVPAPVAGVLALILLGQAPAGDPRGKERFELVEVGAQGGAQALDLSGESAGQSRKVRCHKESIYTVLLTRMLVFSS